jgi:hypothetical protein
MRARRNRRREIILWILSTLIVLSMLCSLLVALVQPALPT